MHDGKRRVFTRATDTAAARRLLLLRAAPRPGPHLGLALLQQRLQAFLRRPALVVVADQEDDVVPAVDAHHLEPDAGLVGVGRHGAQEAQVDALRGTAGLRARPETPPGRARLRPRQGSRAVDVRARFGEPRQGARGSDHRQGARVGDPARSLLLLAAYRPRTRGPRFPDSSPPTVTSPHPTSSHLRNRLGLPTSPLTETGRGGLWNFSWGDSPTSSQTLQLSYSGSESSC